MSDSTDIKTLKEQLELVRAQNQVLINENMILIHDSDEKDKRIAYLNIAVGDLHKIMALDSNRHLMDMYKFVHVVTAYNTLKKHVDLSCDEIKIANDTAEKKIALLCKGIDENMKERAKHPVYYQCLTCYSVNSYATFIYRCGNCSLMFCDDCKSTHQCMLTTQKQKASVLPFPLPFN